MLIRCNTIQFCHFSLFDTKQKNLVRGVVASWFVICLITFICEANIRNDDLLFAINA